MARAYQPNQRFFKDFAVGPEVRGIVRSVAEDAKAIAEGLSQGFRSERQHEHYADSFEVSTEAIEWKGEHPGPRMAGRLENTSGHAAAVEWGYRGRAEEPTETSAHRVLGRTLDILGKLPSGQPE